MKVFLFLLLFSTAFGYNPCKDSLFIELSDKTLKEMAGWEYSYYVMKEKECDAAIENKVKKEFAEKQKIKKMEKDIRQMKMSILLLGIASLITVGNIFALSFK